MNKDSELVVIAMSVYNASDSSSFLVVDEKDKVI